MSKNEKVDPDNEQSSANIREENAEKPISQSQEEEDEAAKNFKISSPIDNRRGGLGDNISDELGKLPGGKYLAKVVDGVSTFIVESPLIVKTANKIRSLPGGNTAVDVMRKTYGTITSKPVLRTLKATSAITSIAIFPIGTVAGGLSLAAVLGNILKETLDVRKIHRLDAKIANLESIKKSKQQEVALITEKKKTIAKDSPGLQEFLDSKTPIIYPINHSPNVPFEGSRLKEFGRAIRDSSLAATSLIIRAVEFGNPIGIVAAVATGVTGALREADGNLARRKQINNKKNEVNKLNLNTGHYQNAEQLKERERQERVKAKTLEEFVSIPGIDKLSKEELEQKFNEKQKEVESRDEFKKLPEKTSTQKFKSAVKAGWGYFAESQFGDLKKLYSKKEEQTQAPVTLKVDKKSKQEKPKEKKLEQSKGEKKVYEVQQKLSKGQSSTQYKNSISPPTTPNLPLNNSERNH